MIRPATMAGNQRERDRARAREDPDAQAEPREQDGPHVDRVEKDQHRRHPERHEGGGQPVASKRPRRQRDASDPAGREQPRGGQARQGDPVALRPTDAGLVADHAPEERDVAGEGRDLEEQAGGEPARFALVEPPPGVAEAREVRQHDVESAQRDRREGEADQQLLPGYASGCLVHSRRKVPGRHRRGRPRLAIGQVRGARGLDRAWLSRLRVALRPTEAKNDTRFISDDPSVVPWRHVEAVAGPKLALGSVVHFQRHAALRGRSRCARPGTSPCPRVGLRRSTSASLARSAPADCVSVQINELDTPHSLLEFADHIGIEPLAGRSGHTDSSRTSSEIPLTGGLPFMGAELNLASDVSRGIQTRTWRRRRQAAPCRGGDRSSLDRGRAPVDGAARARRDRLVRGSGRGDGAPIRSRRRSRLPVQGRVMDRIGQTRVIPVDDRRSRQRIHGADPARTQRGIDCRRWPRWLVAGLGTIPTGTAMRTLWSDLVPEAELRQAAFALDAVAIDVAFIAGPLIAAAVIAACFADGIALRSASRCRCWARRCSLSSRGIARPGAGRRPSIAGSGRCARRRSGC